MPKISEVIVETLKSAGIQTIFGIPSIHNIGFYEALRKAPSIRHILCRHEASATHMADGYARCAKGVGVVVTSTGPGAAYGISPLTEAFYSCSPVLTITTNARTNQIGRGLGVLHELDHQQSLFKPVTKKTLCLRAEDDIRVSVESAIYTALRDRPGPVYLEVPNDLWDLEASGSETVQLPASSQGPSINDLDSAAQLLKNSKRPLIISGIEAVHAGLEPEIVQLAEALGAPVLTDSGGKGILSEDHPLAFGNATRGGVIKEIHGSCDVTLAVGTRLRYVDFMRRGIVLPGLIHIDWDRLWVNKNFESRVSLIGDVKEIVKALIKKIEMQTPRNDFAEFLAGLRKKHRLNTGTLAEGSIEVQYLECLRRIIPKAGILAIDNTILGYLAEQAYPSFRPLGIVPAKGSTPIGFAFPAAIGLKIADPSTPVVALIGDGGFLYGAHELATCVQHGVGFPVIVVNDNSYRMIDYLQQAHYRRGYQTDLTNPDFVALANSFQVKGIRVDSPAGLGEALEGALASGEMRLIELAAKFPDPPFGL